MEKYTLTEARIRRKMTQRALSDASGFSEGTINGLETGRNVNPTIRTVARLALALGIDPGQLRFAELEAK